MLEQMPIRILIFIIIFVSSNDIYDYLEKYGRTTVKKTEGLVVLDVASFESDEKIHMQYTSHNGYMKEQIDYEFSNSLPSSSTYMPINQKGPSSKSESTTTINDQVTSFEETYYYDIKKESDTNYLIMRYSEHKSDKLEIENTRYNMATVVLIIVLSVIGVVILIIVFVFIFIFIRRKRRLSQQANFVPQQPLTNSSEGLYMSTPQPQSQYINPSPYGNNNYNYGQQQQQSNPFYEPPPSNVNI